jgi:hypothetical protein
MKLYGISYQSDVFDDKHRMGFITSYSNEEYGISVTSTAEKDFIHRATKSLEEATKIVADWIDRGIYPLSAVNQVAIEPTIQKEENNA